MLIHDLCFAFHFIFVCFNTILSKKLVILLNKKVDIVPL